MTTAEKKQQKRLETKIVIMINEMSSSTKVKSMLNLLSSAKSSLTTKNV